MQLLSRPVGADTMEHGAGPADGVAVAFVGAGVEGEQEQAPGPPAACPACHKTNIDERLQLILSANSSRWPV